MYFFVKALNPRPTFHLDMTAEERAAMNQHVAYWSEKAAQGIALVFGPVMAPDGVFGMGVYQVRDEAELRQYPRCRSRQGDLALRGDAHAARGRRQAGRVAQLQRSPSGTEI